MLAVRENIKYKATERKSLILRVPDIPPKIWRKKNKSRHTGATNKMPKGRNLCLKDQQFDITPPPNNRRSLPYTLPRPGKSKTNKPKQKYHKLDSAELFECHQAYQT